MQYREFRRETAFEDNQVFFYGMIMYAPLSIIGGVAVRSHSQYSGAVMLLTGVYGCLFNTVMFFRFGAPSRDYPVSSYTSAEYGSAIVDVAMCAVCVLTTIWALMNLRDRKKRQAEGLAPSNLGKADADELSH